MLSGVKTVARADAERLAKAEKKNKRKEKKKKNKKDKHEKRKLEQDRCDSSWSDSEYGHSEDVRPRNGSESEHENRGEDAWQQHQAQGAEPKKSEGNQLQREDWMTVPMARSKLIGGGVDADDTANRNKAEEVQQDNVAPKPLQLTLHVCQLPVGVLCMTSRELTMKNELNPYLKGGSCEGNTTSAAPVPKAANVGDGGASWRMKALKRAQAQAKEEGKALNDVVSERWGSLSELSSGLTQRRAAPAMAHMHAARSRKEGGVRGEERGERAGYLEGVRSARSQMMRPRDHDSLSWRRDRGDSGREERGRGDRAGKDVAEQWQGEGQDGGRREGSEDRRRDRDSRRSRDGVESIRVLGQGSVGRERDQERERGSPPCRAERGRDGRGGGRGREEPPQGRDRRVVRRRDPLGRGESAALLQTAAAELNTFNNDGSFLERFAAQQAAEAPGAAADDPAPASPPSSSSDAGEDQAVRRQQPPSAGAAGVGDGHRDQPEGGRPDAAGVAQPGSRGGGGGNKSAAAMLKARLQGRAGPAGAAEGEGTAVLETVVLPLVDAQGKAVPGAFGREKAGAAAEPGGRPKRVERYEGGEKARYYRDDDVDLQTLVKRTKYEGVADMDSNLAHNIMRKARFKEKDLDADAEYDHDAGLELADSRSKRGDSAKQAQREKQRQIKDYNRLTSALDKCSRCFASASRPRHLTIAIGQSAYLALPERGRLVPGHCCIIPTEHVPSARQLDEAAWTDMRNFKKCLIQMFMKQGMEVLFFETALGLTSMRSHAVVECVPVPPEAATKAPMYFKKAVDDVTSDWAQHHAKRIIDTKAKGLRGSIPPNFPYMHVEWGLSGGIVHVIDDESKFDRSTARNIMIGLLGLPQEDMHRRARQESSSIQTQWAAEFRKQFEPYDWTKMLE